MTQHEKMVSILVAEDVRLEKKEGRNTYRIGHYLEALEYAENHPKGIEYGLTAAFVGSLRAKLIKAIGGTEQKLSRPTSWAREFYFETNNQD